MLITEFDEQKVSFKSKITTESEKADIEIYTKIKNKVFPKMEGEEGDENDEEDFDHEKSQMYHNDELAKEDEIFMSMVNSSDPVMHTVK